MTLALLREIFARPRRPIVRQGGLGIRTVRDSSRIGALEIATGADAALLLCRPPPAGEAAAMAGGGRHLAPAGRTADKTSRWGRARHRFGKDER